MLGADKGDRLYAKVRVSEIVKRSSSGTRSREDGRVSFLLVSVAKGVEA